MCEKLSYAKKGIMKGTLRQENLHLNFALVKNIKVETLEVDCFKTCAFKSLGNLYTSRGTVSHFEDHCSGVVLSRWITKWSGAGI
jgi:hypothetical protein